MVDPPEHGSTKGTPLWVKVLGGILILVILLLVVLALAGGGHGPRRHLPSGGHGTRAPLAAGAAPGAPLAAPGGQRA